MSVTRAVDFNPARSARRLRDLPMVARFYVCATVAAGALCIFVAVPRVRLDAPVLLVALLAVGVAAATLSLSLPLLHDRSSMSLSHAVVALTMLATGTGAAVLVAASSALAQSMFRTRSRSPWYQRAFNASSLAITVAVAGGAFFGLRDERGDWLGAFVGPLGLAALLYFGINTALVAGAVALAAGQSPVRVWRQDFMWSAPGYFVGTATAGLAFVLVGHSLYWWAAVAVPIYVTYHGYRTYASRMKAGQAQIQQALNVQFAIVEAMAVAIESKDRTSPVELHWLALCAEGLGRAVGLSEAEIHALRTAALLHDIGNLAVPEHILAKPDQLTFEEFQKVKIHPRVGAEILKNVPFAVPVAPLILAHHEHWDGSGYPAGLKGPEIPLAARILAVADCFIAVRSDRPHRRASSGQHAIATLKRCAGTSLDPRLVDRFLEILPQLQTELIDGTAPGDGVALPTGDSEEQSAYEDIAVARNESQALFEMAQSLASVQDTDKALNAIVNMLDRLTPIQAGALFLWDQRRGCFYCRCATGADREALLAVEEETLDGLRSLIEHEALSGSTPATGQAVLIAQLSIEDRRLGALAIIGTHARSRDDHQWLLEHIAPQAAIVIQNAIAFEQTRELSLTDQLTELPNRRFLTQHLAHEFARADRLGRQVALLMMDVDGFKQINDAHGHSVGDRVLCEIGRISRSQLRLYDVCARYGGDEFVLVLWDCNAEQAERRGRELEELLAASSVRLNGAGLVSPKVSIGDAVYPEDGQGMDQLLATADRRMYARKFSDRHADPVGVAEHCT